MAHLLSSLKGLTAFVTGGASGLGAACVKRLLERGCNVVCCDLQPPKDRTLTDNKGFLFVKANVTSDKEMEKAFSETKSMFSNLHILVNCAGIGIAETTYNYRKGAPHSLESFRNVIMVNTVGTFNAIRLAASHMINNEEDNLLNEISDPGPAFVSADKKEISIAIPARGVIINTASIAAYDGQRGQVAYAASKGAIVGMTLPLARDLTIMGVRVVTIAPGLFETPLLSGLPEKVTKVLADTVPFPKRLGRPEEYAHLVECIIANPMLNGEVIRLDGALRLPP